MKSTFKKISALVLALVMVLAMGTTAFAAGDDGRTVVTGSTTSAANTYTGANNTNATSVANGTTIPLTKSIVFVNANGSAVYEPNITYTYTVTPETVTESTYTVNDGTNSGYVHSGVTGGVTGVSIQFGTTIGGTDTTAVTTSAAGVEVERTANLTVDVSKFNKPGIYRYKIAETSSPAAVTDAGLTARTSDYNADRYLDVYIHYVDDDNDSSTPEVLKMYGAVIFKSTATTAGQDNITTSTTKTTGYEPSASSGGDLKDDATVDRYTTYDFTVKKTVSGSMADKTNNFPFYVNITNTITGAKYTYFDDPGTGAGAAETIASAAITKGTDSKESTLKLKDGEYVKFVGVPSNQTTELSVVVKELNNTFDQYTPSVTATNGTITLTSTNAATGNAMAASTGSDTTSSFTVKTNDVANQVITINNNLTEISPTGVVLRVAPYALMLGAGIVLFLLSRRRKEENEA